jgi:thiosulfate reductase cytochrome b subunit
MKMREKHALPLRLVHWLNVPFLGLMIWSGWLIYWANDIYAPVFFPKGFYEFFDIPQRLAEGLSIHFFIGWLFVLNGLIYLIWLAASGHWREIFPSLMTFRLAWPTLLYDFGIKKTAPPQGKFNAMQRITYSGILVLAILGVLSGFAIYKPVQLSWLAAGFGGYNGARLVHFVVMIALCIFVLVHIVQVIRAGWNNFRAMVAGFEVERD